MTIENDDLASLRETTSKALLAVLWLHVPMAITIGMLRGAGSRTRRCRRDLQDSSACISCSPTC